MKRSRTLKKYYEMFERRADKGQCINQPYLGCREFAARFKRVIVAEDQELPPIDDTRDLGWMLYDLDYSDRLSPQPQFFRAQLCKGVGGSVNSRGGLNDSTGSQ